MTLSDIDPRFTWTGWEQEWERMSSVRTVTVESLHRRRDGALFPVEITANYCELTEGTCLFSFVADISARKEAEQALRDSEERYRTLFETAEDGILLISIPADGVGDTQDEPANVDSGTLTCVECNPRSLEMLRCVRQELLGTRFLDFSPAVQPDGVTSQAKATAILRQTLHGKRAFFEWQHCRRDGTTFEAEVSLKGVPFGHSPHWLAIVRDITDRRLAEEERSRLAKAVEQATESILITDDHGTIQYVNPAFERVSGYSREEVVGDSPRKLKSGKHDDTFYEEMWTTIARGEVWKGRLTNRKKDGTIYEEEATISPICDATGKIVNYVGVRRDVTRETELEQQLLQSRKMEAIGTLAGGIAHDFNNMLAAIIGYTELALMGIESGQPDGTDLRSVLEAANRAKELVGQILTFSRQKEARRELVTVGKVIGEVLRLLRASFSTNITIDQEIDCPAATAMADTTQIHQVITNLCSNAAHAMRDRGGVLRVALTTVDLCAHDIAAYPGLDAGPYLRLTVSDTGEGMSEEIRTRVFDPFFTTKAPGEGTGMGLAVAHGIIKSHGGTITVSSEMNKGSTFEVLLPRADGIQVDPQKTESNLPCGHEHVLLVDDEVPLLEMGSRMLVSLGYTVVTRPGGREALQTFLEAPQDVDLVMTDLTMPEMNGLELANLIHEHRPGLPIILWSGYSQRVPSDAHLNEIAAIVRKPLGRRELAFAVRRALDGT